MGRPNIYIRSYRDKKIIEKLPKRRPFGKSWRMFRNNSERFFKMRIKRLQISRWSQFGNFTKIYRCWRFSVHQLEKNSFEKNEVEVEVRDTPRFDPAEEQVPKFATVTKFVTEIR